MDQKGGGDKGSYWYSYQYAGFTEIVSKRKRQLCGQFLQGKK